MSANPALSTPIFEDSVHPTDVAASLRIAHLTFSVSTLGGGISEAVRAVTMAQQERGIRPKVVSVRDAGSDLSPWPEGSPRKLPSIKLPGMALVPGLADLLSEIEPDAIHTHGLWSSLSIHAPAWSRPQGKPYLVAPHGMLDAWALANSRWKKQLAGRLFERRHLGGAACLHALCDSEAESIRGYGLKNPICVIPNGIGLPADGKQETGDRGQEEPERKVLLFLGRIHPKKGLVNALRAWAEVRGQGTGNRGKEEWQFVISGWDQGGHEAELKQLCTELGLGYQETPASEFLVESLKLETESAVTFTGPAFGETKDRLLRSASAFILPSFSEGLPMSVLEAWAYRLPVLMTDHCNLPEGFAADAAIRIGTDSESIAEGMRLILLSPTSDLRTLAANGRTLVEERFTWHQVAGRMKEVYEWVLGGGGKPECVRG